jgi:hypothetical protein
MIRLPSEELSVNQECVELHNGHNTILSFFLPWDGFKGGK